ncbi:MAG: preprotein translocase subunit SecG [Thermoguttaceae bacterium]|jgi:preprotein translocase subunit SecG
MFYYLFMVLLLLTAVFLILLVLIQRGKGGGLTGALGGMGGQSAFGTKAGDLFTRITIGVAAFWIVLCLVAIKYYGVTGTAKIETMGGAANESAPTAPDTPGPASAPGPPAGGDSQPAK